MKNPTTMLALLAAAATPALASWLIAGGSFPAEILCGAYTILGLVYLTALTCPPARPLRPARPAVRTWIRNSLHGSVRRTNAASPSRSLAVRP